MKISSEEVNRLLALSMSDRAAGAHTAFAEAPTETGEASGDARNAEIHQVTRMVNHLPDVRRERVEALKAQIEAGTYYVSGEDIADLIIRRALADNTSL